MADEVKSTDIERVRAHIAKQGPLGTINLDWVSEIVDDLESTREHYKAQVERSNSSVAELAEAIRLTVEYVGLGTLRPAPGWSWYDALVKYAPEVAASFTKVSA